MKNYPAAFINVLNETGTKEEILKFLQQTWNERCILEEDLIDANARLAGIVEDEHPDNANVTHWRPLP